MIRSICVCGAGTMGAGIAQTVAQHGFQVILYDHQKTVLGNAQEQVGLNLQSLVDKHKISATAMDSMLGNITFTLTPEHCVADLIIEAIIEKPEAKIALFRQMQKYNSSDTIFATNTSSLSVTSIAEALDKPSHLAGLHFFNPPAIMKLVEIVRTQYNSDTVIQDLLKLSVDIGKIAVVCKDSPGFIVNRVARPYYIEALRMAEEGVPLELIDILMESAGFRMGPFKLMDLIGNDINFAVSSSVYEQLGQPERLKPSFLQEQKLSDGLLGRKSGAGFYTYHS